MSVQTWRANAPDPAPMYATLIRKLPARRRFTEVLAEAEGDVRMDDIDTVVRVFEKRVHVAFPLVLLVRRFRVAIDDVLIRDAFGYAVQDHRGLGVVEVDDDAGVRLDVDP